MNLPTEILRFVFLKANIHKKISMSKYFTAHNILFLINKDKLITKTKLQIYTYHSGKADEYNEIVLQNFKFQVPKLT